MSKCLVILSGGQDSTTCLFWAKSKYKEVHAITFDYGQRHSIELEAAVCIAKMAGVESHEIISIPECLESVSPLLSGADLDTYSSVDEQRAEGRASTFIPMRNALFITIAANRAETLSIDTLVLGVSEIDTGGYDDCRGVFLNAAEQYINTALGNDHRGTSQIKIEAPLLNLTKLETVKLATTLTGCMEALAFSHTCYAGQFPPCSKCHSCVLRADGFKQAGVNDPVFTRPLTK